MNKRLLLCLLISFLSFTIIHAESSKVLDFSINHLLRTKTKDNLYHYIPAEETIRLVDDMKSLITSIVWEASKGLATPWTTPRRIKNGVFSVLKSKNNQSIVLTMIIIMIIDSIIKKLKQEKKLIDLFKQPESYVLFIWWIGIVALYGSRLSDRGDISKLNIGELMLKLGITAGTAIFAWNMINSYLDQGQIKFKASLFKAIKTSILSSIALGTSFGIAHGIKNYTSV